MFGFDNGTTIFKGAHVDPTGRPVVIPTARGDDHMPSVVYVSETGDVLVGKEALEQGYLDPSRCARNFKLDLGSTASVIHAETLDPTEATAHIIRALKADAQRQTGIEVNEAVLTCPANSRDDFKQALIEAAGRAGIKVLKLVPEPTAAGLAYACEKEGRDMNFVVYDFGGGTFDVSVMRTEGSQITVLATEGVTRLGGNDFNTCLRRFVEKAFKAKFGTELDPEADPLISLDLDQRIENAKISLNTRSEVPLVLGYKGESLVVPLKQDEFHDAIRPLVEKTLGALDDAVQAAGLKTNELDRLIMVGGSSKLNFVQDMVANHTGLMPRADIDPQKAIAYGAALASVMELRRQGRTATLGDRVIPCPDAFVRDVTAHSVGCCAVDTSGPTHRLANAVLIPKNKPIPCQVTDEFYLEHEDQVEAHIEILQGEPDADRDDCLLIGELCLENLPKENTRTRRIHVEYSIDANGMVTATATDKVSGQTQSVSVDYKRGIGPRRKPDAA